MKKIIFFGSSFGIGGAEKQLINYANNASKQFDTTVLVNRFGKLKSELSPKVKLIKNHLVWKNKNEYDAAVNFHDWDLRSNKRIMTVNAKSKATFIRGDRAHLSSKELEKYKLNQNAFQVFTITDETKDTHKKIFNTNKEIEVIPNPILFNGSQDAFEKDTLISISNAGEEKNHHLLMEILKKIDSSGLKIKFEQYGISKNMNHYHEYQTLAKSLKNVKIHLNGKVPNLWSVAKGSLLIHTSTFEGFPNAILECLARNIGVVSTKFGKYGDNFIDDKIIWSKSFDVDELARLVINNINKNNFKISHSDIEKHNKKIFNRFYKALDII